ncbi:hypothetical protein TVAG_296910 [Trichomonas vaginalis G3]|uniref:Uncharacterized protein n=1 Tax=Trichomonas vaginalis (strain ATCC PRA-98 / G3) TaxID=412133 RepID=A2DR86_TRIV3|nr:hypothetical protein TVAGG3_0512450 [Trichomonas vaginalis G3]EAY17012.1 hypothetical protein TVAG_296910 [Trichomonas vaginalis G3]KAI5517877.1 hypothetical protein TVAGG3_0512450 [Trichomonas vaginalis G3]|eukprot:XP_001329235.1 hypothetical protein [Trichomonas vaginalis G3]
MGCGGSVVDRKKSKQKKLNNQVKATCVIYGLPDRGQQQFADSLNKTFMTTAFSQITYSFVVADSSRLSRKQWPKLYSEYENVFITFYFPDLSSPGQTLLSVKSLNWLLTQLKPEDPKPIIIAKAKNAKEKPNLLTFQDRIPDDIQLYTPVDGEIEDAKKYYEMVNMASERIKITPDAK